MGTNTAPVPNLSSTTQGQKAGEAPESRRPATSMGTMAVAKAPGFGLPRLLSPDTRPKGTSIRAG